jgi:hypothetical protein
MIRGDCVADDRPPAEVVVRGDGLWVFFRTYQLWRERGTWWARQGAGWFRLILMLLALTMGLPAIASPVIGG